MVIDDIKALLGVSDSSKDAVINVFVNRAVVAIKKYLDTDQDVITLYSAAVVEYVMIQFNRKGKEGLSQATQGNRSSSLINGIPESVKELLPLPSIKMMG